jgi:hypothetical protein
VRIGYANNPQVLRDGLKEASRFLAMLEQERSMTARQGQLT